MTKSVRRILASLLALGMVILTPATALAAQPENEGVCADILTEEGSELITVSDDGIVFEISGEPAAEDETAGEASVYDSGNAPLSDADGSLCGAENQDAAAENASEDGRISECDGDSSEGVITGSDESGAQDMITASDEHYAYGQNERE